MHVAGSMGGVGHYRRGLPVMGWKILGDLDVGPGEGGVWEEEGPQ